MDDRHAFAEFAFESQHYRKHKHGPVPPWATGGLGGVGLGGSYFPGSSPPMQTAQFGDGDNDADDHGGAPDSDDGPAATAGMGNAVSTAGGSSS